MPMHEFPVYNMSKHCSFMILSIFRFSLIHIHLGVVAIEKGAFGLPSTMVANFTLLILK